MNMNKAKGEVISLHRLYTHCLEKKMEAFIAQPVGEVSEEKEWCAVEKKNYFDGMKDALPTEYENIMRF